MTPIEYIKDLTTGQIYARLERGLSCSERELEAYIGFSFPDGFASYRKQIQLDEIWPMIVIKDIEVDPAFQHRTHGSRIMKSVLEESRAQGARTAFLRVGWHSENPDFEREWRIKWYAKLGFKELANTNRKVLVPFMYCAL